MNAWGTLIPDNIKPVTDGGGQPQPHVTIGFQVVSGPNALLTLQAVTDAAGHAVVSYTSTFAGTDTWQASIANASGGAKTSNLAAVTWPALAGLDLFVGYADDLRPNPTFPTPWQGSPNVLFLGTRGYDFDGGAVRLDNTTDAPIPVDKVTVDLQRRSYNGPVFDLWPSFVIPPHTSAILTQTDTENFDTSDFPIYGCEFPIFPGEKQTPKIAVTVHGLTTSYLDIAHVLDTGGFDANCQLLNESRQWREVGISGQTSGQLVLRPATAAAAAGTVATVTAVALDGAGDALPNVAVSFTVLSGPNAGKTGQVTTDPTGAAVFTYGGTATGLDTLQATITNAAGGVVPSGTATVLWLPQVSLTLTPAAAAHGVGTAADLTLRAADASGQPVQGLAVTFRVASGPNAGRIGHGVTGANGQAGFTLTSNAAGTDTLDAELILLGGGTQASNPATVIWSAPSTLTLAPPATTLPVGGQATLTAQLLDGTRHPVAGAPVTVNVLSGPNTGSTGQSTTDAAGQALFSYTGTAQGTDILQATSGVQLSNLVTATWTAVPTTVTYTGARAGEPGDPLQLSARLTDSLAGTPLAGQTLTFLLGTQAATATTGPDGVASATITPQGAPGAVPLTITFAGSGPYTGSSAALLISLQRLPTVITFTGRTAIANGLAQPVSAKLTDAKTGQPLAGKTVTFTTGTLTATAVTDATGTATTTLTLPTATGPATLKAAFAGDTAHLPSSTTVRLLVYQPSSFVIWGGNTPGLLLGQRVNFWGSQWEQQVTSGDYQAHGSFKGYGTAVGSPITLCEPSAKTTGTPRLDQSCWTSKPGNSNPPATLGDFIQVIVSTSIAKQGSTIYGNIASTVVVQVDRTAPYAPDPGHPGYGTIVAVIEDGGGLFPQTATTTAQTTQATETLSTPIGRAVAAGTHRYSLYSPELHLIAETDLTTATRPAILNEYVWLNGHPIAQMESTGVTNWTFTDHLGTPILQTSSAQGVTWRAEYEPFGEVYALRSYDRHQPLRLPGQEAEQLAVGANGVTERSYNIHRWYRGGWGRYSQADPIGIGLSFNLYGYTGDKPVRTTDALGLADDTVVPLGGLLCTSPNHFENRFPEPRKNCLACNAQAVDDAIAHVAALANKYCSSTNTTGDPYSSAERSSVAGGVIFGNKRGPWISAWIKQSGDPCVDYCRCTHEGTHARLGYRELMHLADYTEYYHECTAYTEQLACLSMYKK